MRVFAMVVSLMLATGVQGDTLLLRYPDIHGDRVVFCYGGDLWTAPASGGKAVRLTAHPGVELFPRFSPDGKWIAFTGQYDGDEQVYVIPSEGGEPRQLTFYPARGPLPPRWGSDNQVIGWTRDGKAVLFRSMRDAGGGSEGRLYTVPIDGGLPEPLPMQNSGAGDFSPDGTKIVYSPLARDFRTWKRYEGGWAQDLFILDLATLEQKRIAPSKRTERDPMWIGDKIYFVSDRDGWLNLYSYDPATGEVRQLTHSTTWDVRWPGYSEDGRIVYEYGGQLRIYDTRDGSDKAIEIQVPDDGLWKRRHTVSAADFLFDADIGPTGKRVVIVARGEVITVPVEKGPYRNLTNSPGQYDRAASWSPYGKTIAYISDATGEDEIWLVDALGKKPPKQLTTGAKMRKEGLLWSPDSKKIAFWDKDQRIWVVEVESGKQTPVARDKGDFKGDLAWSPDSRWLAFSMTDDNWYRSIYVWDSKEGKLHRVTGEFFDEMNPAWDPSGKYLYFIARHGFAPQHSEIEWNFAPSRMMGIYALALTEDVEDPYGPQSDEEGQNGEGSKESAKKESKGGEKTGEGQEITVKIQFEDLAKRVSRVPIPFDNYSGLEVTENYLVFSRHGATFEGREPDHPTELHVYDKERRKDSVLVSDLLGWSLSHDGKKVLVVSKGKKLSVYDVKFVEKPAQRPKPKQVKLGSVKVEVDPPAEWKQIFWEVWRRYRDYFYVENMHGYDWEAIGKRYAKLLPYVAHRSDLNYLLGEMIAELNVGHAYVSGGDIELPERPKVALPGARFCLDREAHRYKICKIFRGENTEPEFRCPLAAVGVKASVGDWLIAIDGTEVAPPENPYRLLRGKGDRPITLTLAKDPQGKERWDVQLVPVTSEANLIYNDWVEHNREYVAKATNGRVGYIHIPNMGAEGAYQFIKSFYPQVNKEALIVDERSNGGGYISQWLIERLRRKLMGLDYARTFQIPETYPNKVMAGPMVALINGTTASDGDIFAYMFREAGLGPLVGTRTWGGVVGITGHGPLIDGGTVYVPEFGNASADGRWVIEGEGVQPDYVVEQDPKALAEGRDPQLDKAIELIMAKLPAEPKGLPPRPEPPVKTPAPVSGVPAPQ